jgi:hypothetical protein
MNLPKVANPDIHDGENLEVKDEIPEGWEFKPKYKSHQEAERGAREHQKKVTEATEQAKRDREAREATERELNELKQKLETAPEKPAEPVKTSEELEAEQEGRIETALDEISQLDEFDPEYKKKVARAWRKAGVGGAGQPAIPIEEITQRVREQLQAESAQVDPQDIREDIRAQAAKMAGKSGLDMEEGSADSKLFWSQVPRMPKELDGKPFEEQVQWAVNEAQEIKRQVLQSREKLDERGRKVQVENAVLERGAERPKTASVSESFTLGSIMNKHLQSRRI